MEKYRDVKGENLYELFILNLRKCHVHSCRNLLSFLLFFTVLIVTFYPITTSPKATPPKYYKHLHKTEILNKIVVLDIPEFSSSFRMLDHPKNLKNKNNNPWLKLVLVFRVLGIYNFDESLETSKLCPWTLASKLCTTISTSMSQRFS